MPARTAPLALAGALLAGTMALLTLALGATAALAAPTLTAAPNPVNLASCRDTGQTTLTWTGALPSAPPLATTDLWVSTVPNMPVLTALPTSGTYDWKGLSPGTHVATLKQTIVGTGVQTVATASVTVTCPRQPQGACPADCFTAKPTVTPGGTHATFDVTTNADTTIAIDVGTQPPGPNGELPPASIVGKASGTNKTKVPTQHTVVPLQAKTFYHYVVKATDATNVTYKTGGTFTTLTRKVVVNFITIDVHDDSDAGSEGDLVFRFRVDNGPIKEVEAEVDSGESALLALLFTINDAPATMTLKVQGCDDDSPDFPITLNGCETVGFGASGSTSDADFSYVEQTFDHGKKTGPKDEKHSMSFKMTADSGAPTSKSLKFTVNGDYHVSYQ